MAVFFLLFIIVLCFLALKNSAAYAILIGLGVIVLIGLGFLGIFAGF